MEKYHGLYEEYNSDDGQLSLKTTYKDGEIHGSYESYYSNEPSKSFSIINFVTNIFFNCFYIYI